MGKYSSYPKYKTLDVEWLDCIPEHWSNVSLKMMIDVRDGTHDTPAYVEPSDESYPLVTSKDVTGGYIDLSDCKQISRMDYELIVKRSGVAKGDILMPMIGTVGSPILLEQEVEIAIKNLALFRTSVGDNKLCRKYLFYFLNSSECSVQFSLESRGGVQNFVSLGTLRNLGLPLVPRNEQTQIANFLDHETAKIDTLIEKQQQLIKLLKEKRQAVISHAVTKGLNPQTPMKDSGVEWLGEVPEHWVVTRIKYVADLTPNKDEVKDTLNSECNFVPMEKLKTDSLKLDEVRLVGDVIGGYTYFKNGDILLAKVTPCFENKNMAIAQSLKNGIGFGSSEIYVLRPKQKALTEYIYYRLQEDTFIDLATGEMTGAGGLKRVPSDFLVNFKLALPEPKECSEIVTYIKQWTKKYDQLIRTALVQVRLMQERRTALISAAVTGKIDVRNWQAPKSQNQK